MSAAVVVKLQRLSGEIEGRVRTLVKDVHRLNKNQGLSLEDKVCIIWQYTKAPRTTTQRFRQPPPHPHSHFFEPVCRVLVSSVYPEKCDTNPA